MGTASRPRRVGRTVEEILAQYEVDPETGCWEWGDLIDAYGYGYATKRLGQSKAHRLSYVYHVGPIPDGLLVCHSCDNRRCINPEHLWVGTHSDNTRDAVAKGRWVGVGFQRKEVCVRGHALTLENTRERENGYRRCVQCRREVDRINARKYRERRRGHVA